MMKRNALMAAAMLVGTALMGGCVKQEYSQNATVNQDPLVVDQAMQLRDWDKSYAIYQNGSTENWSTGFAYTTSGDVPQGLNYVTDTGIFLVNVATLPYTAYEQRHGQESSGVNVPETYTAAPVLPPRYQPTGGPVVSPAGGSNDAQTGQVTPINTVNNPDAENNNSINPTYPNNPTRTNANNAAAGAVNDTTSGGANGAAGGKAGSSGSSMGSGGAGAGGAGGAAGGK